MKVGLYFGSFNPIHHGHLIIASHVVNHTELDEVWFVVSPQNPFKNASGLLNEHHRLSLVRTALEGELKLKASNVEFKLPKPSFTIDTLAYLSDQYPATQFSIVMGSDGFQNIEKWKNYKTLLAHYPIYIYKRPGFEVLNKTEGDIKILDAPLLDISSTLIREYIRQKKNIRYLVPDAVKEQIEINLYYSSNLENPAK